MTLVFAVEAKHQTPSNSGGGAHVRSGCEACFQPAGAGCARARATVKQNRLLSQSGTPTDFAV